MSIAKPFTFTANTYAKASEVNADFDTVYSQVNTNISAIAQNATDIDNLENNKANINGSTSNVFKVADAISNSDAINKQTLFKAIGNSIDYISGLVITKDSGSPDDTIIVSAGSCYDSTKAVVLSLDSSLSKQNLNQGASTTYYVYIIGNSTGSLVNISIDDSSVEPPLPTGYSLYRQIGSYTTDADSKIDSISYYGESVTSDKNISNLYYSLTPNYNAGIDILASLPYTCPKNGVISCYAQSIKDGYNWYPQLHIDNAYWPLGYSSGGYIDSATVIIPVSKGSVISTSGGGIMSVYFFPLKGE